MKKRRMIFDGSRGQAAGLGLLGVAGRGLLKLARHVIFFLLWSFSSHAIAASTPVNIGLDWYINPNHAPLLLAVATHRFEDAGLEVKLHTPTDTTMQLKLLLQDHFQAAVSFEPQWEYAKKQGLEIAWLVTLVGQPLEAMAVNAEGPIKNLQDLKGKKVGYSGGGSTKDRLETVLKHEGLSLSDIELINVKMNESLALLTGQVDAIAGVMRNVEPIELKHKGFKTRLFPFEEHGVKPYSELILVIQEKNAQAPWAITLKQVVQDSIHELQQDPEGSWNKVKEHFHSELAPTETMETMNHEIWQATVPFFKKDKE